MFRMWSSQSSMGFRYLWYMDLFRMFWKAQRPWSSLILRQVHNNGQMERCRIGKNESRW